MSMALTSRVGTHAMSGSIKLDISQRQLVREYMESICIALQEVYLA